MYTMLYILVWAKILTYISGDLLTAYFEIIERSHEKRNKNNKIKYENDKNIFGSFLKYG